MTTLDIEAGRYIVFHNPGLFGQVISWSCKSPWNHAAVSLGGGEIAEATPRYGVRVTNLSRYAGHKAAANLGEPMTRDQLGGVAAAARAMTETSVPYDFPAIGDLGLEDLGVHWRWLLRLSGASHCLICSAAVADCGAAASPPLDWLCGRGQPCQVRPCDLGSRPGMVPVWIGR